MFGQTRTIIFEAKKLSRYVENNWLGLVIVGPNKIQNKQTFVIQGQYLSGLETFQFAVLVPSRRISKYVLFLVFYDETNY